MSVLISAGGRGRTDKHFIRRYRLIKHLLPALPVGLLIALFAASSALAAAPEMPETVEANPIGTTTATLHGVLDPGAEGEPGSYDFSYEPSSLLAPECGMPGTLAPSSPVADAGVEGEAKTVALTGLEPNREYAFCIVAYSLTAEASYGVAVPFKTHPLKPTFISENAAPKAEEARLEALVNPNNESTECHFQYGETSASENILPCEQEILEGFGEQGVGLTVPGLKQNTTYHYRVVVTNATGKTEGTEKTFTTAVRPTTPETEAASAITGTTATLNGTLKPPATKLKYEFEYNAGANCEGPATTEDEGEGKVSVPVSGLEGSSEYSFCLVAINDVGESAIGAPVTFKTPAAEPVIVAESYSGLTPFAVTLQAEVNPENQPTACVFEYGETVTEHTTPCEQATLTGGGPQTATLAVSGLKSGTKYHYRVIVKNATGKVEGTEEEFTTLTAEAPTIYSEDSSGLSATGVGLEAHINPDYQPTTYAFEYATNAALTEATTVQGTHPLAAESGELPAGVLLSGLTPGTTYYYRVTARNGTGTTTDGTIESFTTPLLPLVSTGEAQGITQTTATLSGMVNPQGSETTYYFQYISEARYQTALAEGAGGAGGDPYSAGETTVSASAGSGTEPQSVGPTPATGLLPGTTYHYRVIAYNEFEGKIETSYGQDETFTTLPSTPPLVRTGGASGVSQNSATLSGTVGTNSLQTEYGFEIGTEPGNYGPATGLGSIGGAATEEVHVTLSKLQPGTTYYYRIEASNADGTVHGAPQSFTTPGFPTLISPPAAPPLIAYTSPGFPKEEKGSTGTTTKTPTNQEKLSKALKQCKKDHSKTKRQSCERAAKKKYASSKKANGKRKKKRKKK